jgi:hypothetical protein
MATAALWVRSYFVWDKLDYGRQAMGTFEHQWLNAASLRGTALVACADWEYVPAGPLSTLQLERRPMPIPMGVDYRRFVREWGWEYAGIGYVVTTDRGRLLRAYLIVPHWFLVALFAALPVRWAVGWYRRRRPPGACSACGYDLRATPGRCPECGTVVHRGGAEDAEERSSSVALPSASSAPRR